MQPFFLEDPNLTYKALWNKMWFWCKSYQKIKPLFKKIFFLGNYTYTTTTASAVNFWVLAIFLFSLAHPLVLSTLRNFHDYPSNFEIARNYFLEHFICLILDPPGVDIKKLHFSINWLKRPISSQGTIRINHTLCQWCYKR